MPTPRGHEALIQVPNTDAGSVSQTGTILHRLCQTSVRTSGWTANINEPAQDATGQATTAPFVRTQRRDGLGDWTASFNGYFPSTAPLSGHVGDVTFAAGYVNRVESFGVDFAWEEFDNTGMGSTPPSWRSWRVGLCSATFTYRARADNTTAIGLVGSTGSATFRLSTGSPNNTLVGEVHINTATPVAEIGGLVVVDYSGTFNGQVTSAGGGSLLPTGTITEPEEVELNLWTRYNTRGLNGRAFLTALGIQVAIGSPITVSATIRGSGDLTSV